MRLITAARSVDIDLIEPIRETIIEATKQKKKQRAISCEGKMLHGQLYNKLRKWGIRIGGNSCEMGL